ncbi:MAG: phage portal protein [Sphingopyxis sp.]
MNIFGFKSRRSAARLAGTFAFPTGKPAQLTRPLGFAGGIHAHSIAPANRSYDEQVRRAYAQNPVAQRCCRLVAEAVAGAPLNIDNPRIAALISERAGGQVLLESVASQLMLHGNAYVQLLGGASPSGLSHSQASAGELPAELYALRPERVSVEVDAQGWPVAFAYRVGGQAQRLNACDAMGRVHVVHIHTVNPLDDHYGLGCLSAAAQAVAIHNSAGAWNQALLDNAARPSGALVYEGGDKGSALSDTQFERLKAEMEAQFQGSINAGRPMLLDGGLKWQAISMTPAEMDFLKLKDSAARDIAMAFGVPPMLIGIPGDATYANYREASKALWRQTVLPMLGAILASLRQALATWDAAGSEVGRLGVALDHVPALSEDRERLWSQVSAADFLSADEKRAMLGIAPSLAFPTDKSAESVSAFPTDKSAQLS